MPDNVLAPGTRLGSTTGDTWVVVLASGAGVGVIQCGRAPMLPLGPARCGAFDTQMNPGHESVAGMRYEDAASGLLVQCIRSGPGRLSALGRELTRAPKEDDFSATTGWSWTHHVMTTAVERLH
jgi:hypothetical protein